MDEQKVIDGIQNMLRKHTLRMVQAGLNHKRRVRAQLNYIKDLQRLKNYLYGGPSTVRNIPGYERRKLNDTIRDAERRYVTILDDAIREIATAIRQIHHEHMAGMSEFNKNWTLLQKATFKERQSQVARRGLNYIQAQIRSEPELAKHNYIKTTLKKFKKIVNEWNSINRNVKNYQHRIRTMKRKFPGSF